MTNLTLELNINSASHLVNVNLITKMDVFAAVTIRGDDDIRKKQKAKTPVDRSGGSYPIWNYGLKLSVNERLARDGRLTLGMRLISRRILGNKDIGGVHIPLLELLNSTMPSINSDGNDAQEMKLMTCDVRTRSGKWSGFLTFSYRFKPDSPVIVNQNPVGTPACPPPSPVDHRPSAPPEFSIEFPKLPEPPSHSKHPFAAAGSSDDPLPISEGARILRENWRRVNNHIPPPPSYQKYGPYRYSQPSPLGHGYGRINN